MIPQLREQLGLPVPSWAHALGVSRQTVLRWELGQAQPTGLHREVMNGIKLAIDHGSDAQEVGRLVSLGIGALIFYGLCRTEKTAACCPSCDRGNHGKGEQ